jgi:subtilisin
MPEKMEQFVVLPARGLRASSRTPDPMVGMFLQSLSARIGVKSEQPQILPGVLCKVIDSIREDGAKLVQMRPSDVKQLHVQQPGVRVVPVRFYQTARHVPMLSEIVGAKKLAGGLSTKLTVKVVSVANGQPVRNVHVIAFTNFAQRAGAEARTNAQGVASLDFGTSSKKIDKLFLIPDLGFWDQVKSNFTLVSGTTFKLPPIDLSFTDCVRHFYPDSPMEAGQGVTVGVVDTGVGPHPDLVIAGGKNCVTGQNPADFGDNGDLHGTHVGGIIASRGTPPHGVRGIAAGVTLRSYRVFAKGKNASNFDIAKAVDAAVADGCDLINMSLGGGSQDEAIHSAVTDARAAGVAVIIAAGNDERSPVSFPASESLAVAVSAFGRKGTLVANSKEQTMDVKAPFGSPDAANFIASFSNVGPEIDLTGPGVGVISTVLGGHGVMSGTSMACPAVTGAAARLLAGKPEVLAMDRDEARSDRIVHEILTAAKSLGFGSNFQGQGALI